MATPELDALIAEHISELEESAKHVYEIEERIFKTFDTIAEAWASDPQHRWEGEFDSWSDNLWLAPPEWVSGSGDESEGCYYYFDAIGDDNEDDHFNLSELCHVAIGR